MTDDQLSINMMSFDDLVKQTITQSMKLIEYFQLNLIYYQLISGKGLEFEKVQEYHVGDDVRRIDWKILARTQEVHVRTYKEERRFNIVIVLDVSNSMLLGTSRFIKNEYASLVAGVLAYAALEAGDSICPVMVSSDINVAGEPLNDVYQFLRIISKKENYGGKKDWRKMVDTLISNYDDDSIVFLISDFIDFNPDQILPPLAAGFGKVFGIMVRDKIDDQLPKGVGPVYLTDAQGKKVYLTNFDKLRDEYQVLNERQIKKIKTEFLSEGQLFFKVNTTQDFGTEFIKALGHEEVIQ